MSNECVRAETLAGAVALGEASEAERELYRRHLAGCGWCIANLGGEREIERVMRSIAQARDDERWEPDLRDAVRRGKRGRRRAWKLSGAVAVGLLAVSFGIHGLLAGATRSMPVAQGAAAFAPSAKDERAIAAISTQTAPRREQHAESLAVAPEPGMSLDASATFGVSVDARGLPVKCTIDRSSGYRALDDAVCRAALQARYAPRRIDGRAVPSLYRGAFTVGPTAPR